jgi:hypothetical protein
MATIEAASAASKAASGVIAVGSGSTVAFALDANWVGVIAGIVIGLAGLAMSWYFKQRHYALAEKHFAAVGDDGG